MTKPILTLSNLQVVRDGARTLDIESLQVLPGEVLAVIGPNGAGKSTLMMVVGGLIPLSAGEVRFHDQVVNPNKELDYRRRLAVVMQAPLLLHASVYQNVASGLSFRHVNPKESRRRVEEWLEKLNITHLIDRPAQKLSGGEAQRVSLARALVLDPELMLMDEPFNALDAPTRAQLIGDLKQVLAANQLTTLFITHDLDEAIALADRVAVMMNGNLRQIGSPREVFSMPADPEIAHFTGIETILPGQIIRQDCGLVDIACDHTVFQAISDAGIGTRVYLCLRPEDITLSRTTPEAKTSARNMLRGKIELLISQGPLVRVVINGPVRLTALITRASTQELDLQIGQEITASFKTSAIHIIHLS